MYEDSRHFRPYLLIGSTRKRNAEKAIMHRAACWTSKWSLPKLLGCHLSDLDIDGSATWFRSGPRDAGVVFDDSYSGVDSLICRVAGLPEVGCPVSSSAYLKALAEDTILDLMPNSREAKFSASSLGMPGIGSGYVVGELEFSDGLAGRFAVHISLIEKEPPAMAPVTLPAAHWLKGIGDEAVEVLASFPAIDIDIAQLASLEINDVVLFGEGAIDAVELGVPGGVKLGHAVLGKSLDHEMLELRVRR